MARNNFEVKFSLEDFEQKAKKKMLLDEIKIDICALLNTNGGRLVLKAIDATVDNKIHCDNIIQSIEVLLLEFVGLSKTDKNFNWERDYNTITLGIRGLPILCTLNSNLFLPIQLSIIMLRETDRIREILFERRVVELPQPTPRKKFYLGCDSGLEESNSIQLKNLNPEKTKSINLGGRMVKHKLTSYVSGFANHSGGQIFYGINDHGIVVGESLRDQHEIAQIEEKVGNAIRKMLWPTELPVRLDEKCCKKQWEIEFVSVKKCDGETLPLTFVIVISVFPCPGGVFVEEPESYHVVDGKVEKIPFDSWREKVRTSNREFKSKEKLPVEIKRTKWSSDKSETAYMMMTQELIKLRQLGKWEKIKGLCQKLYYQEHRHINTKRVALFHLTAVEYRQGDFTKAKKYLAEHEVLGKGDEDSWITKLGRTYSNSAIERSYGNYEEAWKIIQAVGFQQCFNVPAGLIPAAFYANAALILSKLVDNEAFKTISRQDTFFMEKVQENVKKVEHLSNLALEHLKYVKDDYIIAKEELKQRVNIALASLYLKSESTNHSQVSSADIDKASKKICEAENSLKLLKGTERLKFNECRILLAKSDLCLRQYELKKIDIDNELKNECSKHLRESRQIAESHAFGEIIQGCKYREKWVEENLKQSNDNESKSNEGKSNEMLMKEWLGLEDE